MKRFMVLAIAASLVAGAFVAAPAQAKKKKKPPAPKCAPFTPVEPASDSGETAEALEAPVTIVSATATEDAPIAMEYEHGPALWTITQMPLQEDTVFFNIQIAAGGAPSQGLYLRQEWAAPSPSDMDLYVYDGTGAQVFASGSSNAPEPIGGPGGLGEPLGQETGAQGYESMSGAPVAPCQGFTIESRAFSTMGESMTMKIWLGPIV